MRKIAGLAFMAMVVTLAAGFRLGLIGTTQAASLGLAN